MSDYRIIGGDVGTVIVFTVREWPVGQTPSANSLAPPLDISSATSLRLVLIPPTPILTQGQPTQTVTATFYTDGTDGKLKYTTVSGDIPAIPWGGRPQQWNVRPQFTMGGWSGKGEPDSFWVDP